MSFRQDEFDIRCEWGLHGVKILAPSCDAIIIVDVLSFSTCVDIATSRGACIWPYRWRDPTAAVFAESQGARLAGRRGGAEPSLSPESMLDLRAGARLVLPSPNGSALSLATGEAPTFVGCLRNAAAVAQAAMREGPRIVVIPAGELWPDHTLRPSLEDWLGAGAILAQLSGNPSPEARAAIAAYAYVADDLRAVLLACGSGRELLTDGLQRDVELAAELMISRCAPKLEERRFINVGQ